MSKGIKILGILAIAATASLTATSVYASCQGPSDPSYPVFQCAGRSWFAAPPAGSGTVKAVWWQVGYGNSTRVQTGVAASAPTGTGFAAAVFIGNDSGNLATGVDPNSGLGLDLQDASTVPGVGGPPGALCFNVAGNWATNGMDGCADNGHAAAAASGPYGASLDDNGLNKYWTYFGVYGNAYQADAPMGVLLTESNNKQFSLAFFATEPRPIGQASTDPALRANDADAGDFFMRFINNGDPNPVNVGQNNIIPWQAIPKPTISATFVDPNNHATSDRLLAMNWSAVRVVSDQSVRPSGDVGHLSPPSGGANGVGVLDQGPMVHYAVESAPVDPNSPPNCGAFTQKVLTNNLNASVQVPANTCVRLTTLFGRTPQTTVPTAAACAVAKCGDIGYQVTSPTVIVGGSLVSQKVTLNSVTKAKGDLRVTFTSGTELSVSRFDVIGLDGKGNSLGVIGSTSCTACTTGLGGEYTVTTNKAVGGVKSVQVNMVGAAGLISTSNTLSVK